MMNFTPTNIMKGMPHATTPRESSRRVVIGHLTSEIPYATTTNHSCAMIMTAHSHAEMSIVLTSSPAVVHPAGA